MYDQRERERDLEPEHQYNSKLMSEKHNTLIKSTE